MPAESRMKKDAARELLTYRQVASELQVQPRTVKRYVQSGRLRVIRISTNNVRIDREDFRKFLQGCG